MYHCPEKRNRQKLQVKKYNIFTHVPKTGGKSIKHELNITEGTHFPLSITKQRKKNSLMKAINMHLYEIRGIGCFQRLYI